jgi:hypothetical protein
MHTQPRVLRAAGGAHPEARHARHEEQQAPVAGAHCAHRLRPAPDASGLPRCTGRSAALARGFKERGFVPLTTPRLTTTPRLPARTLGDHRSAPHVLPDQAARNTQRRNPGCWPLHKRGECTPKKSTAWLAAQQAPRGARAPRAACRPAARVCAGAAQSPGCPGCSTRPAAAGGPRARAAAPPALPPSCALRGTHTSPGYLDSPGFLQVTLTRPAAAGGRRTRAGARPASPSTRAMRGTRRHPLGSNINLVCKPRRPKPRLRLCQRHM